VNREPHKKVVLPLQNRRDEKGEASLNGSSLGSSTLEKEKSREGVLVTVTPKARKKSETLKKKVMGSSALAIRRERITRTKPAIVRFM